MKRPPSPAPQVRHSLTASQIEELAASTKACGLATLAHAADLQRLADELKAKEATSEAGRRSHLSLVPGGAA